MPSKVNLPMDEVIEDYQSGMTLRKLSEWYGYDKSTIRRLLLKEGVGLRSKGGGVNRVDLPLEEIIKDYESGITTVELGKRHGVSDATIVNRLKEHGIEIRSKGEKDLPMLEIILSFCLGLSLKKLVDR